MAKVLHVITGLGQGGAERQLSQLVTGCSQEMAVFSILSPGVMSAPIEKSGVKVYSGGAKGLFSILWVWQLYKAIKEFKPEYIMGWMYHGNLAVLLARLFGCNAAIHWNIRHSISDIENEKRSTRIVIRLGCFFSRFPKKIVYNSVASKVQHGELGFREDKAIVIPNGIDVSRFRPNFDARFRKRNQLSLDEDKFLIGVVGRSHPMKNHQTWIHVMAELCRYRTDVHGVVVGRDVPAQLNEMVNDLGLNKKVFLLDGIERPEALYPALDLLVLPSAWGEGFSNVVGEAMACGIPVLVSPQGDSPMIVGDESGFVAEDSSLDSLKAAAFNALGLGKIALQNMGGLARLRVVENFSNEAMLHNYKTIFS